MVSVWVRGLVQHHQRPQEFVPVRHQRDQREGDQAGLGHRQQHVPQDLPPVRAVDHGGFLEVARDLAEGLAHQEGAEGRGEVGRHDAEQRAVEAEIDDGAQVGHDQDRRHQHELQQEDVEDEVAAGEAQPREGVAGERDGHELHRQDAEGHDRGVDVVDREVAGLEGFPEVIQGRHVVRHQRCHADAACALGRNDATSVHRNGVDHRNAVTSISPPTMRLVRFMAGGRATPVARLCCLSGRTRHWSGAPPALSSPHGRLVPWS